MRRALLTLLALAVFALLLYRTALVQADVECQACMRFGGREHCARVRSSSREAAADRAVGAACSVLASGVTESLRCQASPPASLRCREP